MPYKDLDKAHAYERERHRKRVASRFAQGLCPRCGKRRPAAGHSVCAPCCERRRESERARYARGKAAGEPYGGRNPGYRRRMARERNKLRRRERRETGLCTRCGDRPPLEGSAACEPCREARRADERELYAARRARGACTGGAGGRPQALRSAVPAPRSMRGTTGRRRTPPAGGATPVFAPGGFAPIAENQRRGRRGVRPARTAPMCTRASTAAYPSTPRATPWSNSPPARTTGPGTAGRRSPCASPSPGSHARKSRSSPTHRPWQP